MENTFASPTHHRLVAHSAKMIPGNSIIHPDITCDGFELTWPAKWKSLLAIINVIKVNPAISIGIIKYD